MAQITIDCFLPFPSASFARGLPDLCLAHRCSSQWWRRFQFSTALTASAAAVFCAKTGGAGQPASTASVCALQSGGLLSCSLFLLYIYRRYLRAVATATTANSKQAKKKRKKPSNLRLRNTHYYIQKLSRGNSDALASNSRAPNCTSLSLSFFQPAAC